MKRLILWTSVALCLATFLLASGRISAAATKTNGLKRVTMVNRPGNEPWAYAPKTITIRAGQRVAFVNHSSQPHTVTATGGHPAFDSGITTLIEPKHTWFHTFRRAGKFSYFCQLHPYMTGVIIVKK